MNKPVLLCDMDGVLVDILGPWLREYALHTDEWIHPDDITAYHHEIFVRDSDAFWASLPHALLNATPIHGSLRAMRVLQERFDIYLVTYAHPAASEAHAIKLQWLERWLPFIGPEQVIFTGHKHLVRGDVFIDDAPANVQTWAAANPGKDALLFKAPYNDGLRWDEILTRLERYR